MRASRFKIPLASALVACGPNSPHTETSMDQGAGVCGDGILDADEACDDGDVNPGDGCSPTCLVSGTHLDCVTLLEGPADNDVSGLVAGDDSSFFVGGSIETMMGRRAWIARFSAEGTKVWMREIVSISGDDESLVDLAENGAGGAWALISSNSGSQLLEFDAMGTTTTSFELGSSPWVYAIAQGGGDVWLAGEHHDDAWVGRFDPVTNMVTDIASEDHLGYRDHIGVLSRQDDTIAVGATWSSTPNSDGDQLLTAQTEIAIIAFDLDGNEVSRRVLDPSPTPELARRATALAWGAWGSWVVGGRQDPILFMPLSQAWLSPTTPSAMEWSSLAIADAGHSHALSAMVAVGDHIVASGTVYRSGSASGWLRGFDAEATLVWTYENEGDERHEERQLLMGEGGARNTEKITMGESSQIRSCIIAL